MDLKEHFRITRLRSQDKPHEHGDFMLGLPGLLFNKCCSIFGYCSGKIMMCCIELDVALVMEVPEDLKLCHG